MLPCCFCWFLTPCAGFACFALVADRGSVGRHLAGLPAALAPQASSHHVVGPSGRSPRVLAACCCCRPCALTALSCCSLISGCQMPLLVLDPDAQVGFDAQRDGFPHRLWPLREGSRDTAVLDEQGRAPGGAGIGWRREGRNLGQTYCPDR